MVLRRTGSGVWIPAEGHFLRSRHQASLDEQEESEEFTENLSSDTTAETPNRNIKIREPVLEFGAVDKPFKEFGPALEFEGSVIKDHGHVGAILKGPSESGDSPFIDGEPEKTFNSKEPFRIVPTCVGQLEI